MQCNKLKCQGFFKTSKCLLTTFARFKKNLDILIYCVEFSNTQYILNYTYETHQLALNSTKYHKEPIENSI